jgi:hypothetical protein
MDRVRAQMVTTCLSNSSFMLPHPPPPPDQEVAARYRRIRNEFVVYTEKAYSAYGIHAMDRSRMVGSFKW